MQIGEVSIVLTLVLQDNLIQRGHRVVISADAQHQVVLGFSIDQTVVSSQMHIRASWLEVSRELRVAGNLGEYTGIVFLTL